MTSTSVRTIAASAVLLSACAHFPSGPGVMVLPGSGKNFDEFQRDDLSCRDYAAYRAHPEPRRAAVQSGVGSAAVGTLVGAAAGTAIGAAAGDTGAGAAIGAGSGLLLGSAAGVHRSEWAGHTLQARYDDAYLQCMYAHGNQIPLPRGAFAGPAARIAPDRRPPAPDYDGSSYPPPPRAGRPPPPPPY